MDIKKFSQSRKVQWTIAIIVALAIIFAIFQAGVFVGFHKASFLFKSGDNFYRAFGDRNNQITKGMGMGGGMFRDELSGGHGVIGKIVKVSLPTVVVLGPDNIEKVVLTDGQTTVHQLRDVTSTEKLAVDQFISVLGSPNDQGQIVAKFIRIVPPPPALNQATTSSKVSTSTRPSTNTKPNTTINQI